MTIELVRVGDRLVGRTASDRWNLAALGFDAGLPYERNGSALKRARRANPDFVFKTVKAAIVAHATEAEADALGTVASSFAYAA